MNPTLAELSESESDELRPLMFSRLHPGKKLAENA